MTSSAADLRITPGDLGDERVLALLREHLAGMRASSPADAVYALDVSGLAAPEVTFFTAWEAEALVGCGALKALTPHHGEIKSMRTAAAHLRKGVAARVLEHLLDLARSRGYRTVSLETGSGPAFEAALSLYRKRGFVEGEAFGEYTPSAFNRFFHLEI